MTENENSNVMRRKLDKHFFLAFFGKRQPTEELHTSAKSNPGEELLELLTLLLFGCIIVAVVCFHIFR